MKLDIKVYNRAKKDFLSGISITKVAEKYRINRKVLSEELRKEGIPTSKANRFKVLISEEKINLAMKLLEEGVSLTNVSDQLDVPRTTLTTSLSKYGYRQQTKMAQKEKPINLDEVELLFKSGWTAKQIGDLFSISDNTILRRLNEIGVDTQRYWRKHTVNEDTFTLIDSEEKAYWFGFLYADGCVMNWTTPVLSLELTEKDESHLEKFRAFIGSSAPITHRTVKVNDVEYNSVRIAICSKKIVEDLISHGMIERKTFIKKWPNIEENLVHHFIRGYFDGNGSFGATEKSRWFSIATGSKDFANSLSDKFFEIFNRKFNPYFSEKNNTYTMRKSSKIALIEIYYYIYHESSVYLDRKENDYTRFVKENTTNYNCPFLR